MKPQLLVAFGAGLLVGCAPTLAPHTPYLPALRDQGQVEARLSTGLGGSQLQLGYQLSNRLVLHTELLSAGRPVTAKGFYSAGLGAGYYYLSPNGRWRVGTHAGLAYGSGTSGSSSCFECGGVGFGSEYAVRYTYAYVQPTVLLEDGQRTWGLALRLGQTYYHQLREVRTDNATGQAQLFDYVGHRSTFVQPTFQYSHQIQRWLVVSGTFGAQGFLGSPRRVNYVSPFVAQAGLHFVISTRAAARP